ncbi:hypothetical protein DSO57_1016168 [Entomophthora muscae]|uniref:Uncharacterized protein n=1 Tax=Entomophthora muscae TaxID=34485 RepID=A0ACC2SU41_9FUNG|nr:hypothetical protein DSO57_1016168 [Entomophthora muscae]
MIWLIFPDICTQISSSASLVRENLAQFLYLLDDLPEFSLTTKFLRALMKEEILAPDLGEETEFSSPHNLPLLLEYAPKCTP